MVIEGALNFREHVFAQTIAGNGDYGLKFVRECSVLFEFGVGQFYRAIVCHWLSRYTGDPKFTLPEPPESYFMAKKKSSSRAWLKEHHDDIYVQRAQKEGYRSRACYKLLELNDRDRLIKPRMTVLDLGSAPGGWSQVAAKLVGHNGRVIASDILAMDNIAGVEFIQGDFTEEVIFDQLLACIGDDSVDVVLSDMAPNMSGVTAVDQPRSMYLVELALDLSTRVLPPGGIFVTKVFHGEGFEELMAETRRLFSKVLTRKPEASRPRSREVYLVASGFKGA